MFAGAIHESPSGYQDLAHTECTDFNQILHKAHLHFRNFLIANFCSRFHCIADVTKKSECVCSWTVDSSTAPLSCSNRHPCSGRYSKCRSISNVTQKDLRIRLIPRRQSGRSVQKLVIQCLCLSTALWWLRCYEAIYSERVFVSPPSGG